MRAACKDRADSTRRFFPLVARCGFQPSCFRSIIPMLRSRRRKGTSIPRSNSLVGHVHRSVSSTRESSAPHANAPSGVTRRAQVTRFPGARKRAMNPRQELFLARDRWIRQDHQTRIIIRLSRVIIDLCDTPAHKEAARTCGEHPVIERYTAGPTAGSRLHLKRVDPLLASSGRSRPGYYKCWPFIKLSTPWGSRVRPIDRL